VTVSSTGLPGTTNQVVCVLELDGAGGSASDTVPADIAAGTTSTVGLMAATFLGRGSLVTTSCYQASGLGALSVQDVQQTLTLAGAVN
jgi:hypothetical protein